MSFRRQQSTWLSSSGLGKLGTLLTIALASLLLGFQAHAAAFVDEVGWQTEAVTQNAKINAVIGAVALGEAVKVADYTTEALAAEPAPNQYLFVRRLQVDANNIKNTLNLTAANDILRENANLANFGASPGNAIVTDEAHVLLTVELGDRFIS